MELLRIVAMFFIICFHCVYKSAIPIGGGLTANIFAVKSMWYLGELGVNLFMLVTGYFMVKGCFRGSKFILLVLQVLFYWFLSIGLGLLVGVYTFPEATRDVVLLFFPTLLGKYWYVTAYVVIYALSPWINRIVNILGQKRLLALILVLIAFYSVVPTCFSLLGVAVEGMLFYTRLTWLFVIYLIGAYLRLYPLRSLSSIRIPLLLCAISASSMLVAIACIATFPGFFAKLGITEWAFFWPPNTVPMLVLSIGVFGLFLNARVGSSRVVNKVASTTLGIYLIHDGVLSGYIWRGGLFDAASMIASPLCIPYIFFASICVFVVGMIVDLARQLLESITIRPILNSVWYRKFSAKIVEGFSCLLDIFIEREAENAGRKN